ncbi:phosphonate ABC transporter, permease protein PhnE (plasmid) [Natronorubrum bangense]|uniref:Phosphonate ABC transporter, permease protein PhnE n=1 Tax=Natronorubrum bangense TaxID=61858 RepID=A0A4D6HSK0_9EURY|nr:phosphonate ABC transporter, permease protein PhnE [Natronorubrum bangense]
MVWRRPTVFPSYRVKYLTYILLVGFVLWSAWAIRISPERFIQGLGATAEFLESMWPPDFGERERELIREGIGETLAMAVVATILGVAASLPVAFMAARNLAPWPVYYFARSLIMISRSFHSLIIGIIFVVAVGFGPFAGALTLSFATVGFYAKILADDLENIDMGQLRAIETAGANKLQVILYGAVPQALPRMIGLAIYRWDINVRSSTIIGIVGAGGIGFTLLNAFDRYQYDFAVAILIVIVAIVLAGEVASAMIRRRIR